MIPIRCFYWWICVLVFALVNPTLHAQDLLQISEFAAVNDGPLLDEDGDKSDWIEIHNAGTNTVNLDGWFLTDKAGNLNQWRFPAETLPPNGYLVVFASNKNRRTAGAPLHTNFRLDSAGEYLALVRPDGTNVVSEYSPYPPQAGRLSYGIPVQQTAVTLVSAGAEARVLVPGNDSLGLNWTATNFNDAGWLATQTGVGFEADAQIPFVSVRIADSVAEFSGTQGRSNWFYGYWDKGADADGIYADTEFAPFPNATGPFGETNFWNGTAWNWFNGNPPFTQLTSEGGRPNGNNGLPGVADHAAVRRYVSEFDGPLTISGRLLHTNTSGASQWVRVTATGVCQNSLIYIYLTAAGDGYIDDMQLVAGSVPEVGPNLLPNGDFESVLSGPWTVSANHAPSTITTAVKRSGNSSLHVVATAGGTTQASSIWQTIAPALVTNQTYTLSYWYLRGTNPAPLTVRFSYSWISTTFVPPACGDGVIGRIFVDGTEVYRQTVFLSSANYSLRTYANLGSLIDFVLDAGAENNDNCDSSIFTAQIDTEDPSIVVVADSVADWSFSGAQGERNWFYGYYSKSTDTVPGYQVTNFTAFPRNDGPPSAGNFWIGTQWDWFNGNPPWDEISQTGMRPNGNNSSGGEHWVIRRWASQISGRIAVDWTLAKENATGGSGVTGRIFRNGVQVDTAAIAGTDSLGVSRTVVITNVQVGDFIDLALDATGTDASASDEFDGSVMTAVIRGRASLSSAVVSDLQAAMQGINSTVYIRIPFLATNAAPLYFLTLRMQYDDGFAAYLNGVAVAARNAPVAPDVPAWDSAATASHPDAEAIQFEDFDLTPVIGLLRPGTNVLAIHGLNLSAVDSDFLILPELRGISLTSDSTNRLYFSAPTPGGPNGLGTTNLGPLIVDVKHAPNEPADNEDLYVTAELVRTFNDISNVSLIYRVMYSNEVTVPMFDDGLHADGSAGDGVWGGVIPANAASPGQMIRYFIYGTDVRANRTRFPAALSAANSPQYQGTVVSNPNVVSALPVFHWFIQNPKDADNTTGTKCSLFYLGRFYDNCGINLHGQSSQSFPKKAYDIDMNPGYGFVWKEGEKAVDDINLMTTWADKSHMRNILAYEGYQEAGAGYHWVDLIRVQQNGAFHSVANLMENGDANYLERLGLDPNGAFYKMYNGFNLPGHTAIGINVNAEKKTRKDEGNADLVALYNGVTQGGQEQINYVFDNIDIPSAIGLLAGHVLVNDEDCCHKNYYFYRDTEGTGEWRILPWDVDLSFGHMWTCNYRGESECYAYYDPRLFTTNAYSQTSLGIGGGNRFVDALFGIPAIYQMYLRRVRTVTDEQLQPPNTNPYLLKYENRVNTLAAQMAPDAALDFAKWVVAYPSLYPPTQTLAQAVEDLNVRYFPPRRLWIYNTLVSQGYYIAPQPTNATVLIGAIEFNPASGNQAHEYIQLVNTNPYPVDLSGWRLAGAIDYTFRPAVVLPANGALYVSPDVAAFRARPTAPHGGMGLYVQGNYQGQLSARGELVQLVDDKGRLVQSTNYPATPTLAQRYLRVTEIMYHPASSRPADGLDPELFEYLELKNTGPVALNLDGVHLTNGVEFACTPATPVTQLAPDESVLLVHNLAAFTARYGAGFKVAGQYNGFLDNNGENLRLDDAVGEKILDFSYNNSWYPITDGSGFSLVIVDEHAAWDSWGLKASWRPSGRAGGSPGAADPAPPAIGTILINEALTHTDLPEVDAIELFNPTASTVSIAGWFLTDDRLNPYKYCIPDGQVIQPGGYATFSENEFNPGGTGFALGSDGDEVYLYSGDGTNLTGYVHGYSFGPAENGVSFGRHVTSQGEEHFVAQQTLTLNTNNSAPKVGPVVISEIMYHPPDPAGGGDNQDDEFVELRNIASTNVAFFDAVFPTSRWHLRGGIDYDFPTATTFAAGGRLLVVSFDPTNVVKLAAFRQRYGVASGVPVFGPYAGKLDNSADTVRLRKPDAPNLSGTVPYILVDEVDYRDSAPWPTGADGTGASLRRVALTQYGNDPTNWTAAVPTAGSDSGGGAPPIITVQPANTTVTAFSPATFSVSATGAAPLRYQWQHNGINIAGATNAVLTFSPEPLGDAIYRVAVFNATGTVLSSNASLTVLIPVAIIAQPQSQTVFPYTANVSFSVTAGSSTPIRYQWRFNGNPIPNATGSIYTVPVALPGGDGDYTVEVTDSVGPVISSPARLTVLLHPLITSQPTNRSVVFGGAAVHASFAVAAVSATPLRYRWLFNGAELAPAANITGLTNTTLTISNVQIAHGGAYSVVVSDSFGSITSQVATLTVNVKPVFLLHPISQEVMPGGTATFSANWTGSTPMLQWWRKASTTVGSGIVPGTGYAYLPLPNGYIFGNQTSSFLVLTNISLLVTGRYTVAASNLAGQALSAAANLSLTTDTDGDGLPDSWENGRPGFSPTDPADGARDDDSDGMSNRDEFTAGTDYLDRTSYLKVEITASGHVTLRFNAVSNRTYAVQYADQLEPAQWQLLAAIPAYTNTRPEIVIDPSPITNRFYRLATPVQ
jgi:hypothetical protein